MKKRLFITLFILMNISLFGQGDNNDYDIDARDLKSVFEGQGIQIPL